MSYIRRVVGANERLVLITRLHWIYPVEAVLWFLIMVGVGLLLDHYLWYYAGSKTTLFIDLYFVKFDERSTPIPWMFAFIGLAIFWPLFLTYISTEIGLTDRRIIHKRGLILIEVQQVELEDIRGEQVHHGWLGWLLGYGRLHFDCRFIEDVYLPATRDPYRLIKAVHTARMKNEHVPYGMEDLENDIQRLDRQRVEAFKARYKLKKLGMMLKGDFTRSGINTKQIAVVPQAGRSKEKKSG